MGFSLQVYLIQNQLKSTHYYNCSYNTRLGGGVAECNSCIVGGEKRGGIADYLLPPKWWGRLCVLLQLDKDENCTQYLRA